MGRNRSEEVEICFSYRRGLRYLRVCAVEADFLSTLDAK